MKIMKDIKSNMKIMKIKKRHKHLGCPYYNT